MMRFLLMSILVTLGSCQAQNYSFVVGYPSNTKNLKLSLTRSYTSVQRDTPNTIVQQSWPQNLLQDLQLKWQSHIKDVISKGMVKFALKLDGAIGNTLAKDENVLISPATLTYTLAMVLLASSGKTFQEVTQILNLDCEKYIFNKSEIVHHYLSRMIRECNKNHTSNEGLPTSKLASGLFVQDSYHIREQFKAASENIYKSQISNVDFANNNTEAKNIINNWVSNQTMGKIHEILSEPPPPSTNVIISSALYFNGSWNQQFTGQLIKSYPFEVNENETVYVDMMSQESTYPFYEDKKLKVRIVGLPYRGKETTMYVLMSAIPGTAGLEQLKSCLSAEVVDELIGKTREETVAVYLPKMKLSSNRPLRGVLQRLGLESLFNPGTADLSIMSSGRYSIPAAYKAESAFSFADDLGVMVEQWLNGFSVSQSAKSKQQQQHQPWTWELPKYGVDELREKGGLNNPGIYADELIHAVEMTVDEKGTEAAAADLVLGFRGSFTQNFVASRPFLFFIRHDPTKSILFWGSINKPTPFEKTPDPKQPPAK